MHSRAWIKTKSSRGRCVDDGNAAADDGADAGSDVDKDEDADDREMSFP